MKTEEEGKDGEGRDERKSDPKRRRIDGKIHVRPSALLHCSRFYTVAVAVVGREWKETERVMAS